MTFKELTKQHVNNDELFKNLETYVEMIEEKNKVMNLTGFKDDVLWENGIYESIISLESAFDINPGAKLLDIGAGAGFPSVPFKIVHPEIELTIFESLGKRVTFLNEVSDAIGLNMDVQSQRVETSEMRKYFDLITARAVSDLKVIIEASSQLGKIGSRYGFVKGPRVFEEYKNSQKIISDLDIKVEIKKVDKLEGKDTYIAGFTKTKETPTKYPRDWASIVKK